MTEINADCAVGVLADLASRTTTFRNFALKFDTKENTCKRHFYKYKPSRTASEFNLTLSEEKLYPLGKVLTYIKKKKKKWNEQLKLKEYFVSIFELLTMIIIRTAQARMCLIYQNSKWSSSSHSSLICHTFT
jgi:hypothetical protein